ncbi:MAG: hypothetical protein IKP61_10695 [Spirochaetales bacterium]|nr:hypothetical protein [Spirochaetales bacterium]
MKQKKYLYILFVIPVIIFINSCSLARPDRLLEISVPNHPWESVSGKELWYTLKWTYGNEIRSLYLGPGERAASIYVPTGETVLIAAYPLGEMAPFGALITPLDEELKVVLNQDDGVLANELIDLDRSVTKRLNYGLIRDNIAKKCDDMRIIEKISFLRDLQNGELTETSFRIVSLYGIDGFALPNGLWTSEYIRDCSLFVTDNFSPQIQLPEGVFHYLNPEMDRILVLIVDSSGNSYGYLRQSLI